MTTEPHSLTVQAQDRRGHPRHVASLRVTIQSGLQRFDALCTNAGIGGAFLEARIQPRPGTLVQIAVWPTEPGSVLRILDAVVVYVVHPGRRRTAGVGVRWTQPEDPRLVDLVRSLEHRAAPDDGPMREQQTAEFDWNRVGSEGTGVTREYAVVRPSVVRKPPDEPERT